jgi:VanZ family protein
MGSLFFASTDAGSTERTSRFLEPLLMWLLPRLSNESLWVAIDMIRKGAHLGAYGILAILAWRSVRQPRRNDPRPWNWKEAAISWGIATVYAMTDEFHQSLVVSRSGRISDVLLDSAGAAIGLWFVWLVGRWRRSWWI